MAPSGHRPKARMGMVGTLIGGWPCRLKQKVPTRPLGAGIPELQAGNARKLL